jgi:uncharacterized protein YggE
MNNCITVLVLVFSTIIFSNLHAQIGGNQVYQKHTTNYNRTAAETRSLYSTDSTLVVTSKILLNKRASFYVLTIGVSSTAKTVIEANQLTNNKIEEVIGRAKKLGLNKDDCYVDFISETKMYDHNITGNEIEEYFDGFNIRKNLIIKTSDLTNIDSIIDYCSEEGIHDIIKVDYKSEDLEAINQYLFDEALKTAKAKVDRFSQNSAVQLADRHRIAQESFKVYYPKNLYKQYDEASETSLVNTHYRGNYIRKETRKERTFYYDGMDAEIGLDKIIDDISPRVGIQYVFELVMIYELER